MQSPRFGRAIAGDDTLEQLQQPLEIIQFFQRAGKVARAAADLVQEFLRPLVRLVLDHVLVRSDTGSVARFATEGIAPPRVGAAKLLIALSVAVFALLFGQGLAEVLQTVAHRFHGLGLTVQGTVKVATA